MRIFCMSIMSLDRCVMIATPSAIARSSVAIAAASSSPDMHAARPALTPCRGFRISWTAHARSDKPA
jgi:hypothetical protein